MNFGHPGILFLVTLLVPLLTGFFWWSWRTRRRLISEFVPPRLQATLTVGFSPRRAAGRSAILVLAVAALLVALARPRLGAGAVEVKQRGLDIIIAIDTSRSMLAEDAGPGISRLQRARFAALDLAKLAKRDRVGLVAFAGSAFLQCPLTVDDEAFRQSVDALDTGIIQQGGTAIGPAINSALEAFGTDRDNVRVLVMFTDGEEHETGAVDAAERASNHGLRIFTVGVGSARGDIIRIHDKDGATSYLKDDKGNVVKSALNETLLREVASKTGGFYLPLQGARAMNELFTRGLEPLPRADIASRVMDQFYERYQWPLGLAILLLIWETLMPERARTQGALRPMRFSHPAMGSGIAPLLFLALSLALSGTAIASPGSALRQYNRGEYDAAREEYERLAQSRPDDPRYHFNAGTAAYRSGNFTNAAQGFLGSLSSQDLKLQHDGYYNLGNAEYRLGEQVSDPKVRQSSWEQAIRSFESAVKLDAKDPRARQNLEFVRQRLDELKQQQQQQKGDGKDQDKDKDDKDKDKDKDKDQQKKDSKQDKQDKQDPKDSKEDESKDQQSSDDNKEGKDPKQDEPKPGEDPKKDPKKDQPQPKDGKDPSKQGSEAKDPPKEGDSAPQDAGDQAPPGQMTPKQAMRLLETARGEEKIMPLEKRRARARVVKDW